MYTYKPYERKEDETPNEYFERRKAEIYKTADLQKETMEDMEKLKKIVQGQLEVQSNRKGTDPQNVDELIEDLDRVLAKYHINSPITESVTLVYLFALRRL